MRIDFRNQIPQKAYAYGQSLKADYPLREIAPRKGQAAGSPLVIPIVFQREP
ncbi:hypothetical protein [uncultured Draconibacterium sp.]|uniref:hypothetical protein n=1 Tax=uncultured Draconibacterium sp. TaxID=1573823 RepID=UPI003216B573